MVNLSAEVTGLAGSGHPSAVRLFAAAGIERAAACVSWVWEARDGRSGDADAFRSHLESLWSREAPPEDFAGRVRAWIEALPEFGGAYPPQDVAKYAFHGVLALHTTCGAVLTPGSSDTLAQVSDGLLHLAEILDQEENPGDPQDFGAFDLDRLFAGPSEPTGRHYTGEKEEQLRDLRVLGPFTGDAAPGPDAVAELRGRAHEVGRQRLDALRAARAGR
jgi:hypothetical protein